RLDTKLGDVVLRPGDALVVLTDPDFGRRWRNRADFLVVSGLDDEVEPVAPGRGRTLLIAGAMIVTAAAGLLPILHAALAAAVLMIVMRVLTPEEATSLSGFDAIVLGSAVYAGHWTRDSLALAERVSTLDPKPPVWIFSSGPVGDPPKPEEEPVDVAGVMEATGAREHRMFSGKIDRSKLSFGEKAIMIAVKAPEGDFRDWDAIDSWARRIATELALEVQTQ
ncbi:MAG: flavodoxin domain-containing protein, partial [Actinomycetota bacterium]